MQAQCIFKSQEQPLPLQFLHNQIQLNLSGIPQNLDLNVSAQQLSSKGRPKDTTKSSISTKFNIFSKLASSKKGHTSCKQKLLQLKIRKQFKEYATKTPRIIDCIKNISKQIKSSIIKDNTIDQKDISCPIKQSNESLHTCQIITNQGIKTFKMVKDNSVIKQNELRNLLVPTQGDNDVSSDDEDLRKGMNYLFKELVCSVGQNYLESMKKKQKRFRVKQSNKQNDHSTINTQNLLSHQKKEYSKINNQNHHSGTHNRLNLIKH